MTMRSMSFNNANLFLHPVVGLTKTGDVDYFTRVRCYKKIIQKYPKNKVMLSLFVACNENGRAKRSAPSCFN